MNKLRHPRFLGLRDDKDDKEVSKEKAVYTFLHDLQI